MSRRAHCIVILALLLVPAAARASTWTIDPAHSSAQFAVRHLMVTTVRGTLGAVRGTLTLDERAVTGSRVTATVDTAGVDTRDQKRDEHLRSADFLDTATYPTLTFTSKRVEQVSDGRYTVVGDLTLRGVTKEIVLDVEGSPTPVLDPFGNTKLGGTARTRLDRQAFGVAWSKALDAGGLVVGNDVDVTIDVELIKQP